MGLMLACALARPGERFVDILLNPLAVEVARPASGSDAAGTNAGERPHTKQYRSCTARMASDDGVRRGFKPLPDR